MVIVASIISVLLYISDNIQCSLGLMYLLYGIQLVTNDKWKTNKKEKIMTMI